MKIVIAARHRRALTGGPYEHEDGKSWVWITEPTMLEGGRVIEGTKRPTRNLCVDAAKRYAKEAKLGWAPTDPKLR